LVTAQTRVFDTRRVTPLEHGRANARDDTSDIIIEVVMSERK